MAKRRYFIFTRNGSSHVTALFPAAKILEATGCHA